MKASRQPVRSALLVLLAGVALAVAGLAAARQVGQDGVAQQEALSEEALAALTAEVQAQVETLRGEAFAGSVQVAVAGAEEFSEYMLQRMDAMTTPEELANDEELAKMLGLVRADYDLVAELLKFVESQVGGFYDPAAKTFYLMESFQGDLARVILAHELVHALDDQLFDLDRGMQERRDNTDALWAYQALCEGSATAVMAQWTLAHLADFDARSVVEMEKKSLEALEDAPSFVWKPLLGAYAHGMAFLNKRPKGMDLRAATHAAFAAPPASSEQVLHPDKYWDAERRDDPLPVYIDHANVPADWDAVAEDTLGEALLWLVVEPEKQRGGVRGLAQVMAPRLTGKETAGWGGDRMLLLHGPEEGDRLLLLATAWDSEEDAREFEAAIEAQREHLLAGPPESVRLERDGEHVVLVLARGAGAALVEAALGWPVFAAPPVRSAEPGSADGG